MNTSTKEQKRLYDKIGRAFCLVFNRATMYRMNHPYTAEAIADFYDKLCEGLKLVSPIVIIMRHDHFYIEDEPLAHWLKTSRMVIHFKKSAVESVAFEAGLKAAETENFLRVFCDRKQYPDARAMAAKFAELGVTRAKLNYVFYNKVTSDERIISENKLKQILAREKSNPHSAALSETSQISAEKAGLSSDASIRELKFDPKGGSKVRTGVEDGRIDANNIRKLHDANLKTKKEPLAGKNKRSLPREVLNRDHTLLHLEKEIHRTLRYKAPFSAITFSIFNMKPQQPVPAGAISGIDISNSVMQELITVMRDADLVGIMNNKLIIALLPMTDEFNAKTALQRIFRKLHKSPFIINDIPIVIQFAGAVTTCTKERTPDLQSFLSTAENNHIDLVSRLRNVQELK